MVFGQEPCPAGRYKRRNVCCLGLLPLLVGGWSEITGLYRARYGAPRAGRKVFIVTCQTQEGWEGPERETSAIVPERAEGLQAAAAPENSQKRYMHNGRTPDVVGASASEVGPLVAGIEPGGQGGMADGASSGAGAGSGEAAEGHSVLSPSQREAPP